MKSIFTVIGNCQAPLVAEALLSYQPFFDDYEYLATPPVHTISKENIPSYYQKIKDADLIIYQPVLDQHRYLDFETSNIRVNKKIHQKLVCIPSCYFNGYFPTIGTMAGLITPANQVHDFAVFHAYLLGKTEEQAVDEAYMSATGLLPKAQVVRMWEAAINSLALREAEHKVDVSISDIFSERGKEQALMYQFNHPTGRLFSILGERILAFLGYANTECAASRELNEIQWPVLPYVSSILNMGFEGADGIIVNGNQIPFDEYVAGSYAAYSAAKPELLRPYLQQMSYLQPLLQNKIKM